MYKGLDLKRASRESGMRVILYLCACIYMRVARSAQLAIHKLSYSQLSMGIVIETMRLCIRARQCIFIGYSGENAILTNFHLVWEASFSNCLRTLGPLDCIKFWPL